MFGVLRGFILCFCCIFSCLFCVVSTSASDCLERLVSEMTCYDSTFTRTLKNELFDVALWNSLIRIVRFCESLKNLLETS